METGGLNSSGNEEELTSTSEEEEEDGGQQNGGGGGGSGGGGGAATAVVGVVDDEAFETLTAEIKYEKFYAFSYKVFKKHKVRFCVCTIFVKKFYVVNCFSLFHPREVLAELAQDKAMDAFRGEYEKLYAALERSHRNEKRLSTRCTELMSEIANGQVRGGGRKSV